MIGGPTATGKTGLAIRIARELGSPDRPVEILSADSRQVYRGMNIGTAKPTLAERWRVPHHLLDLADPDQVFSVADFIRAADPVLADLATRSGVALLVGGTGLWLRAIATGLDVDASPA
ncbi:MAG TPA: isopentenyl transferase family protein, partial [Candidatus Limnocylindrales bacterium]